MSSSAPPGRRHRVGAADGETATMTRRDIVVRAPKASPSVPGARVFPHRGRHYFACARMSYRTGAGKASHRPPGTWRLVGRGESQQRRAVAHVRARCALRRELGRMASAWRGRHRVSCPRDRWEAGAHHRGRAAIRACCPSSAGALLVFFLQLRGFRGRRATGTGVLTLVDGCTPDCASAPRHQYAARIVVSRVVRCGSRRVYSTITAYLKERDVRGQDVLHAPRLARCE
jgi:hypothetical protein